MNMNNNYWCPLYQDKVKEGEENRIYMRTNN